MNLRITGAPIKRPSVDFFHSQRNKNTLKGNTIRKCTISNLDYTFRNFHFLERGALPKRRIAYLGHATWYRHTFKGGAPPECIIADHCHARRNRHTLKPFAVFKCTLVDRGHAFRNITAGAVLRRFYQRFSGVGKFKSLFLERFDGIFGDTLLGAPGIFISVTASDEKNTPRNQKRNHPYTKFHGTSPFFLDTRRGQSMIKY